jgi:hypothetical protein
MGKLTKSEKVLHEQDEALRPGPHVTLLATPPTGANPWVDRDKSSQELLPGGT